MTFCVWCLSYTCHKHTCTISCQNVYRSRLVLMSCAGSIDRHPSAFRLTFQYCLLFWLLSEFLAKIDSLSCELAVVKITEWAC